MEIVVYTQRVEVVESYNERRDCVDQRIGEFIYSCGYLPVALPNNKQIAMDILDKIKPIGIVFTGGNDLVRYGGNASERDELEDALIIHAEENHIPIYGFCRGMQMIAYHYGAQLENIGGHVAVKHSIVRNGMVEEVNSFHRFGLKNAPNGFEVISCTEDGVVEEIRDFSGLIWCTMWHPEREMPFRECDVNRLRKFLEREDF